MKIPPGKKRNRPTELGREAGKHLARFCDEMERKKETLHPRCKTCAFRAGSIPNGCESTVMDALKCSMEDTPFMCHERKGNPCSGWVMMRSSKPFKVTWPFSYGEGNAAPLGVAAGEPAQYQSHPAEAAPLPSFDAARNPEEKP